MGDNIWRDESSWPPERARIIPFYLAHSASPNSGALSAKLPPDTEGHRSYRYDPNNPVPSRGGAMLDPRAGIAVQNELEKRADVVVFYSVPLENDVEVTGNVSVMLYVTTTAPSTDFTAKLVDQHADGTIFNVSDGILRRYDSDSGRAPTEIKIDLWPTSMVFKKGHRIGLEISSSNFPRYDRNPNTGTPIGQETQLKSAGQSLFFGTQYPSRLMLSVVPR